MKEFLDILWSLNEEDKYIAENSVFGQEILGTIFNGLATNWEVAKRHLNWMENFSHSVIEVCQSRIEELKQIRSHLETLICEQAEMFSAGSPYFNYSANLRNAYREFSTLWHELTVF